MLEDTTIHNAITDKALASYFRSSGNLLEEESAVLGQAVTNLMLSGDNVNNKNIILSLIHSLETTSNAFSGSCCFFPRHPTSDAIVV